MSLWICLRFYQLPLQCLNHSEDQAVLVLHKQRIIQANNYAAALGIKKNMRAATARALAKSDMENSMLLLNQDPEAEQRALQQLCCWAYGITPTLYVYRSDCLQLEIGSCLKLFNGLEPLLANITHGIKIRGYYVQYGLAPTAKAAWLLSFTENKYTERDTENTFIDSKKNVHLSLEDRLAPLPLTLLNEFPTAIDSLHKAGFQTLGDILSLPMSALSRRCGKGFTHFLQQALGQRHDLKQVYQAPESFSDTYWFGYEVNTSEELFPAIELLLHSFCHFLRNTQLQANHITWQLSGINNKLQDIAVHSSSSHSHWESWYQLTKIHLEQLQLNSNVEGLSLNCSSLHAERLDNLDMFCSHGQREPLNSLVDRLQNRLGLQSVEKIHCRDEHLPEFSMHLSNNCIGENKHRNKVYNQTCAQRPFWLMPHAEALKQHGGKLYWNGALNLIYGPERVEDNWWQKAVSRDYYIAENSSGHHYWVFNDRLTSHWFIHGIFP